MGVEAPGAWCGGRRGAGLGWAGVRVVARSLSAALISDSALMRCGAVRCSAMQGAGCRRRVPQPRKPAKWVEGKGLVKSWGSGELSQLN